MRWMTQEMFLLENYTDNVCRVEDVKHLSTQIAAARIDQIEVRPTSKEIGCCNRML